MNRRRRDVRRSLLSCAAAALVAVVPSKPATAQPACGNVKVELRLHRFAPSQWNTTVLDMRLMREWNARRGNYGAPSYSLQELARVTGDDRVLSSAGMTDSLSAPVPVGLLKSAGTVRNPANTASRLLDGVVCVRADRRVSLLSEVRPDVGRRTPQNWQAATASCVHAVQAGPMLVDAGKPLIGERAPREVSRVFAAVDRERRLVLGHSPKATTFDLACTLAAEGSIEQAIALRGDELGGVRFGSRSGIDEKGWGFDGGTIASAIVLEPLPGRPAQRGGN